MLAARGAVCVSITAAHARPRHVPFPSWTGEDREGVIKDVIDLRRGVDLLLGRGDVNPQRIGFVGLSYGADYGAVFVAVDSRVAAAALISGGTLRDWYGRKAPDDVREEYVSLMETVAPDRLLRSGTSTRILFQNGREDPIYTRREIDDFHAALPAKEVIWYDAGHWLHAHDVAIADRHAWLGSELQLRKSVGA